MPVLIRQTYPGTTNGEPVGDVYVLRIADEINGYPRDVFSYTKDPARATTWPDEETARAEIHRRYWNDPRIIDAATAEIL